MGEKNPHQLFLLPFLYLEPQLLSAPIIVSLKIHKQLGSSGKQWITTWYIKLALSRPGQQTVLVWFCISYQAMSCFFFFMCAFFFSFYQGQWRSLWVADGWDEQFKDSCGCQRINEKPCPIFTHPSETRWVDNGEWRERPSWEIPHFDAFLKNGGRGRRFAAPPFYVVTLPIRPHDKSAMDTIAERMMLGLVLK